MTRSIDYGNLMHDAMRSLIRQVLADVSVNGLPGGHHFFITFATRHPDVQIADWLRERYPDEMTIVIQHWFESLIVDEQGFTISLNFGNQPEPLRIPFDALLTFVDPSVEFGLKFENQFSDEDEDDDEEDEDEEHALVEFPGAETKSTEHKGGEAPKSEPAREGTVVSLDRFRKPQE